MYLQHLVRVGAMGHVGRFAAVDGLRYGRETRVICRTSRGLEVGHVLDSVACDGEADGTLLRAVTVEDDLLLSRLERNRDEAVEACSRKLEEKGLTAVLMDVEHLFDGESLYFYFLGEVTEELETLTSELAEAYETKVQFRKFTETLEAGCGPDCGTEAASGGCGEGGCATCSLAQACHPPTAS